MNTTELAAELDAFYAREGLEPMCAAEALYEGALTEAQRRWLEAFSARWKAAEALEDAEKARL